MVMAVNRYYVMRKLIRYFVTFVLLSGFIFSCTDTTDEGSSRRTMIKPGFYSGEIVFSAEASESKGEATNRGFKDSVGEFTNEYPYDTIYIHSSDNEEIADGHRVLAVPLDSIESCGDCRGIRFDMTVHEDGSYTLTKNGNSITLSSIEQVYFSSLSTPYWNAKVVPNKTPLTQRDLFVESDANDRELLSSGNYSAADLRDLLYTTPEIVLTRSTSVFRVHFQFTDVREGRNSYVVYPEDWEEDLGGPIENFYIKLYMGPNFCHKFDMYNKNVVEGDQGGFYATNTERYQQFEYSWYTFTGSGGPSSNYSYEGYGYETAPYKHLFSPINLNTLNEDFGFYVFVKYSAEKHAEDDPFWTSDEGAKWFYVAADKVKLSPNMVNYIIMAFHYMDLAPLVPSSDEGIITENSYVRNGSGNGPEKIDIKPIKIIYQ